MGKKIDLKRLGLGLVSLVFALLLFFTAKTTAYNSANGRVNRLTETYTHTLENVPIDIKYNSEEYFISGYSYEAEVYLTSTNRIKLDSEINPDTRKLKVVADLTNVAEGTTKVTLEVKDLPADVTADVRPATMTVTLGRKVTKTFPVEVDIAPEQIHSSYYLRSVDLVTQVVEVTTDEGTLAQIAKVVAKLPDDVVLSQSYHDGLILQAVSETGTVLPGIISPAKAEASVRVRKLTKTVPLVVELTGTLDPSLDNIQYELGLSEVIISGSQEDLDATEQVVVKLDMTNIKKDTRKTVTLSADKVTVTPEVVDVKLTVTKKD